MKLALDALESCTPQDTSTGHVIYAWHDEELVNVAITALKERLAQPEQEPVAKYSDIVSDGGLDPRNKFDAPPQRERVGLTDEEFATCIYMSCSIEAKLKEKNT
jgi:hypothetical protein